jgi:hypothetical protein
LNNSFIERVCLTRKGIPLTLCAIIQEIACKVGIKNIGLIGMPGNIVLGLRKEGMEEGRSNNVSTYVYYDVYDWQSTQKAMNYNELLQKFDFDDNNMIHDICHRFMTAEEIGLRCLRNIHTVRANDVQNSHSSKRYLDFLFAHLIMTLYNDNIEIDRSIDLRCATALIGCKLGFTWYVQPEAASLVMIRRINDSEKHELMKWASIVQEAFFRG